MQFFPPPQKGPTEDTVFGGDVVREAGLEPARP